MTPSVHLQAQAQLQQAAQITSLQGQIQAVDKMLQVRHDNVVVHYSILFVC